ncbi:uncharacterized protein [Typha angustifolia]|uniref:uncharacterized protein n=1 Tax=Typha angustifolia TaxID=59011 RepID=UPI003C2F19BC
MPKPAAVFLLLLLLLPLAAFHFLFSIPRTRDPASRPRPVRRLALHRHHLAFDPLVDQLERRAQERGLHGNRGAAGDNQEEIKHQNEMVDLEYYGEEGRLNATERLMSLFPLIDKNPKDGIVNFEELEDWTKKQAIERLFYSTETEMWKHDKDRDGMITIWEYLSYLPNQEIDWSSTGHGKPGWWKEKFLNADADGNGSLDLTELNDFLHPEDSSNLKVQFWLQKEQLRQMDRNNDERLSFIEFRDRFHDASEAEEDGDLHDHLSKAEKKFQDLDTNKDKFLTAEELKPIMQSIHPGELSYATYYTKYLMKEVDDDRDGKLTLEEMVKHYLTFYNTVYDDNRFT